MIWKIGQAIPCSWNGRNLSVWSFWTFLLLKAWYVCSGYQVCGCINSQLCALQGRASLWLREGENGSVRRKVRTSGWWLREESRRASAIIFRKWFFSSSLSIISAVGPVSPSCLSHQRLLPGGGASSCTSFLAAGRNCHGFHGLTPQTFFSHTVLEARSLKPRCCWAMFPAKAPGQSPLLLVALSGPRWSLVCGRVTPACASAFTRPSLLLRCVTSPFDFLSLGANGHWV